MILKILGCGNSTGVPLIHCNCEVCRSRSPRNKRLRSSAWIQLDGKSFLIDTATDLRQQAIREKISRIDAVLYTHPHADHTHGIDELRSFNFIQKAPIPLYANQWTFDDLKGKFRYIFGGVAYEGGGLPRLDLKLFNPSAPFLEIEGQKIIPLPLVHGPFESVGYRFGNLAYVTDCNAIPPSTLDRMKGLEVLVLDCLRIAAHPTHLNLEQALAVAASLKPKKTFLTHLGHDLDYIKWSKKLPKRVAFAYDGLKIQTD